MGQPMISRSNEHSEKTDVANINTRERRKRLASGLIMFAVSFAVLATLMAAGAGRWWRLALFPLLWGAVVGFFQWRDKT